MLSSWGRIFQTKGIGMSWARTGRQEPIHALVQGSRAPVGGVERSGKTLTEIFVWEQWNLSEGLSKDFVLVKTTENCCREGQNLTVCWICFFCFNLCFPWLLFSKRILSMHSGPPWEAPPLCLSLKPRCLCSRRHLGLVHL